MSKMLSLYLDILVIFNILFTLKYLLLILNNAFFVNSPLLRYKLKIQLSIQDRKTLDLRTVSRSFSSLSVMSTANSDNQNFTCGESRSFNMSQLLVTKSWLC